MIADTPSHGRRRRIDRRIPLRAPRVTVMPTAQQSSDMKRTARRDRVVKSILHAIFSGEVVGGDRLVEEELALRLGVSRTPIREALRELTSIGVIWLKPNHGAMVRPFGPTQLLEIYHMRRLLESEATRLSCRSINRNALREIRGGMQALLPTAERSIEWSERALALDQRLHELISHASGSERLAEEIHRYWTLARSIAETVRNESFTQDKAVHEHTAIIDRLLENDAEGASKAMAHHIDLRAQTALKTLCPPSGRGALRELLAAQAAAGVKLQPTP
jgi:DNA-binding GntR family transcriptional regulator